MAYRKGLRSAAQAGSNMGETGSDRPPHLVQKITQALHNNHSLGRRFCAWLMMIVMPENFES